jgi:cyanophycin synthetase
MTIGDRIKVIRSLISTESNLAAALAGDKILTSEILRDAGVCVPHGREFKISEEREAITFGEQLRRCVVKPPRSSAFGQGVSVDLRTRKAIRKAFYDATLYGPSALVEQFIPGENYRMLVYRGKCLSVIARDLAHVIGDGRHTVKDLVGLANVYRVKDWKWTFSLSMPIPINGETTEILRSQGLQWDFVPPAGEYVRLADVCNYQHGTTYREMIAETHPVIIEAAERACLALGVVMGGVDLISEDLASAEYCINEVNTSPLLLIHYAPAAHLDPMREILTTELVGQYAGLRPNRHST